MRDQVPQLVHRAALHGLETVSPPVAASRDTPREAETGRIVRFMADRTEPTADRAAITIEELYRDYEVWCLGNGLQAFSQEGFVTEFDRVREVPQLEGKIRK
jgi:hypothetical protein